MKFNWVYLILGIIGITAFASTEKRYGKYIFAVVVLGALLLASDKIVNNTLE